MSQPESTYLALVFCVFWVYTLNRSNISPAFYILKTIIVVAYSFVTWGNQSDSVTVAEWIAQGMVWCHWVSLITVFALPDPRFQRRKTNA